MTISRKASKNLMQAGLYFLLTIGLIIIVFPLYITVVTAMKTAAESSQNFFSLPSSFYMENFKAVIEKADFFIYVRNSFFITVFSLLGEIILVPAFAYAVSRNKNKLFSRLYI